MKFFPAPPLFEALRERGRFVDQSIMVSLQRIKKGFTPLEVKRGHKRPRLLTGFTLVEMLVVVGIVALLASIVTVAIYSSRQRARDARRIADINQVRIALEQYFKDRKRYPNPEPEGYCGLVTALTSYMSSLPRDPQDTGASCSASSRYEYYTEFPLQPKQWLLRSTVFELPLSLRQGFLEDVDGNIGSDGGGGWIGGTALVSCTFSAPATYSCPVLDCGDASNDTIYCIRS